MPKTILRVSLALIFIFVTQACIPNIAGTPDPNLISTVIAQTLTAMTPISSPEIPITGNESPTLTLTVTATSTVETPSPTLTTTSTTTSTATSLPTTSPSSTASLTVTPPATSTVAISPGVVQVSVSVPTNCRVGPGVAYARVGVLRVGETGQVVGRHATENYWIIRTPGSLNDTCWLWGQYATMTGDTSTLPALTPPAPPATLTPTPAFDVAYEGMESCTGTGWWVELGLENLGGITFRSVTFTIEDRDEDVSVTQRANGFVNKNGCDETETRDTLAPDASRTVSSPVLTANPTGHQLRATITLCSEAGQNGTCITQTVNMTP